MFEDMMTGLEERSAFTWDSAAWIYSVIIAVVLVRYFLTTRTNISQTLTLLPISGFYVGKYNSTLYFLVSRKGNLHGY